MSSLLLQKVDSLINDIEEMTEQVIHHWQMDVDFDTKNETIVIVINDAITKKKWIRNLAQNEFSRPIRQEYGKLGHAVQTGQVQYGYPVIDGPVQLSIQGKNGASYQLQCPIQSDHEHKSDGGASTLSALTWNIADVNNNPWEYYVTLDDPNYKLLTSNVETFFATDATKLSVAEVLSQIDGKFFPDLLKLLREKGVVTSANEKRCMALLEDNIKKNYVDNSVAAFLSNKHVGQHRLTSWPDRLLNTIDDKKGGFLYRPTPINYYPNRFENGADWFAQWLSFMRRTGIDFLASDKNNKYADAYQKAKLGNADDFLFMNVMLLAIFDAILVHVLFHIDHTSNIDWQNIKLECQQVLNKDKLANTVRILDECYGDCDVLFLQEVRNNFMDRIGVAAAAAYKFKHNYQVIFPKEKSKNNQTSVICLKKSRFGTAAVEEVSKEVYDRYKGSVKIGKGDVFALKVNGPNLILVSFHGDTGGLATAALLTAIDNMMGEKQWHATHKLVIGLDANTYFDETASSQKGKLYSCRDCNELLKSLSMAHCFGYDTMPQRHTTNCPRTYLQPQLNKAVKRSDIRNKFVQFRSPKDYIVFYRDQFALTGNQTTIDNTGKKSYNGDVEYVIPSQSFPSDHAIVYTKLQSK